MTLMLPSYWPCVPELLLPPTKPWCRSAHTGAGSSSQGGRNVHIPTFFPFRSLVAPTTAKPQPFSPVGPQSFFPVGSTTAVALSSPVGALLPPASALSSRLADDVGANSESAECINQRCA